MNEVVEEKKPTVLTDKARDGFKKYADKYGKVGHTGDEIGEAFAAYVKAGGKVDADKLEEVASYNGFNVNGKAWVGRNIGMKRMNLGNYLRKLHNTGKTVVIGATEIEGKVAA